MENIKKKSNLSHTVLNLQIHLENDQPIYKCKKRLKKLTQFQIEYKKHTHLTRYFELNRYDEKAKLLFYHDIPNSYIYVKNNWELRKNKHKVVIGKLPSITHRQGEIYFLKLLLLNRRGMTSFRDIRTIEGTHYNTFLETCIQLNLHESHNITYISMNDCCVNILNPHVIRSHFIFLILHFPIENPVIFFDFYFDDLTSDYKIHKKENLLKSLQIMLKENYSSMSLSCLNFEDIHCINPIEIFLYQSYLYKVENLNKEQHEIYKIITKSINSVFFLNAPAGCGKSFCAKTISNFFGTNRTLFTASTGSCCNSISKRENGTFGFWYSN